MTPTNTEREEMVTQLAKIIEPKLNNTVVEGVFIDDVMNKVDQILTWHNQKMEERKFDYEKDNGKIFWILEDVLQMQIKGGVSTKKLRSIIEQLNDLLKTKGQDDE